MKLVLILRFACWKKLETERLSESLLLGVGSKNVISVGMVLESEEEEELGILALHNICGNLIDGLQ